MSNAVDILSFSDAALLNRPLFLSRFNDINIYVEDIGKEYEYEEIFERLFDSNLDIFSIFPLGGKEAVIKGYETKGTHDGDGKLNVFIVDGDFDNLWDDQKIISPNLIYLNRYNIESYYCTKDAIIKYVRTFLKCTRREAEIKVHFEEWYNHIRDEMGKLFVLFAVVKRHRPELPNVKLGPNKFLDQNGCIIDEKYEEYLNTICQELGTIDSFIDEVHEKIHVQFGGDEAEKILSIVCGKYQFDSLCRQLAVCCRKNINRDNLRSTLISSFDLKPLDFLKEQIFLLLADSLLENSTA